MRRLIIGGILGGIIVFAWGYVSWMFLPWHKPTISKFQNETLVREAVLASSTGAGLYILPNACAIDPALSPEEQKAFREQAHQQYEKGPFIMAIVRPEGVGSMTVQLIRGFVIQLLGAFLITGLLLWANLENYISRVSFVTLLAIAAGVVTYLPDWNWWGTPELFTLVGFADLVIGWFLAGLVLGKVTS